MPRRSIAQNGLRTIALEIYFRVDLIHNRVNAFIKYLCTLTLLPIYTEIKSYLKYEEIKHNNIRYDRKRTTQNLANSKKNNFFILNPHFFGTNMFF